MYTLLYRSANHSFYWFSARAHKKKKTKYIIENRTEAEETADNDGKRWKWSGEWRYGNCSTCRLNSRQSSSSSKRGGNFAVRDYGPSKKKTHTKAYRESGISGSRVSRVNECEPDNTEYVLPAVVSRRWFTTLRICFIYKSANHKDFWLIASEFLQRIPQKVVQLKLNLIHVL